MSKSTYSEKEVIFLKACQKVISENSYAFEGKQELDNLRNKLGLEEVQAAAIFKDALIDNQQKTRWTNWGVKLAISLTASLLVLLISLSITNAKMRSIRKDTAHNIALVTLSNIDEVVENFELIVGYYDHFRESYSELLTYNDDYSSISDSLCGLFVDYVEGWDYFVINQSPQQTFCTTFELWDYLDDIPLIRRIGNCFAYKDAFLEIYNKEQALMASFGEEAKFEECSDVHQKLQAIMNCTDFRYHMERSASMSNTFHGIIDMLKQYNRQNKQDMHVTDEDLNNLVAPKKLASTIDESYIFIVGPDK